jgi:hypothetical protein
MLLPVADILRTNSSDDNDSIAGATKTTMMVGFVVATYATMMKERWQELLLTLLLSLD